MSPSCCPRLPESTVQLYSFFSTSLRCHVVYIRLSKPPKHSTYSSSLNDSTVQISDLGGKNRWNCFLKNITSSTQTVFSHSFFFFSCRRTIFGFHLKNTGKEVVLTTNPQSSICGSDHLWTSGTMCVRGKMKMFYRSETLIRSKCSLYE